MGSLLHIFDLDNRGMASKIVPHHTNIDWGFEAPRNSLELQLDQNNSHLAVGDIPYSHELDNWDCYPMKTKPSIVARLMGVDMLPAHTKSEFAALNVSDNHTYGKAKPRQHPQEEELDKFKKDFEAWQAAARFKECSSSLVEPQDQNLNNSTSQLGALGNLCPQHDQNQSSSNLRFRSRTSSLSRESTSRIVILKPGPDRISEHIEECCWSTCYEERSSIEDFLEEVKERLINCEVMQGARGSGIIETPFNERPYSDPKLIAKHIAKHVRDSVEINLRRSESTRSCRSGLEYSPERDALSSERLRINHVLKRDFQVNGWPVKPLRRLKHELDWEIIKDIDHEQHESRSFRHGEDVLSPRSLIRSLSAPVSGTSFGKLLLEDRHVLTGAQIRRKHEASSNIQNRSVVNINNNVRKQKFTFKEKVSNFRYSLRGRLFGKKIQSFMESQNAHPHHVNDIMSGPTVVNFNERLNRENSTEVPPSPASVCSSAQEEFWRPTDNPSPASTPELNFEDDNAMPHFFKEISSNLVELRRKLDELESMGAAAFTPEPVEPEIVDYAEIYLRDLLVASGLYHGLSLSMPMSKSVFEQVERKRDRDNESFGERGHKILFDLSNEALSIVLGRPKMAAALRGRWLLDSVWKILREYLDPSPEICELSLENMVACNLETAPWLSSLMDEEISAFVKEVEGHVIGELVDDVVKDIVMMHARVL